MTTSHSSRWVAGLLVLSGCADVSGGTAPAQALGARFCEAVLAGNEQAAVELMTADLRASVARLIAFDAGWRARNPGEKPPLGDGLRLTSWQDAPATCTPGAVTADSVVLSYAPASAPTDVWRDTLLLARVDGTLQVTDIRFEDRSGGSIGAWIDEALNSPG